MNSASDGTLLQSAPDYYARGLVLWSRFVPPRTGRVRQDPNRLATLISRRTNLSYRAILELLGAPDRQTETPILDH
jgi:phosphoglycolate phosphatase-like HAD superfamily hydrolase